MAGDVRGKMEGAFGADFGSVRLHSGSEATALNDRLQAKAFTLGSDIFVRRADFTPGTRAGDELLAHELTHTVQQGAATVRRTLPAPAVGEGDLASMKARKQSLADALQSPEPAANPLFVEWRDKAKAA